MNRDVEDEIREVAGADWGKDLFDAGWPPFLVKATADPFTYMAGLEGGLVVEFESASDLKEVTEGTLSEGWVRLENPKIVGLEMPGFARGGFPRVNFERGMDVRLASILWVVDAPYGS